MMDTSNATPEIPPPPPRQPDPELIGYIERSNKRERDKQAQQKRQRD